MGSQLVHPEPERTKPPPVTHVFLLQFFCILFTFPVGHSFLFWFPPPPPPRPRPRHYPLFPRVSLNIERLSQIASLQNIILQNVVALIYIWKLYIWTINSDYV